MPVAAFAGAGAGATTASTCTRCTSRTAGRTRCSGSSTPATAAGSAVCLDVVYNHLGPSRQLPGQLRPLLHRAARHALGRRRQPRRRPAPSRCGAGSSTTPCAGSRDFHIDALRLDAVHALVDDSPRHLLAQLSDEIAALATQLGRPLSLVAETDLNDPRMVEPTACGGLGMTAQWSDDFHHALHTLADRRDARATTSTSRPSTSSRATLTRVFFHAGDWSSFRGTDWGAGGPGRAPRAPVPRLPAGPRPGRQPGHRRPASAPRSAPAGQAAARRWCLTSPFTPMLFMGEEWAASTPWQFFTDHHDPELAEAVRDGRRREFAEHGWDAEDVPDPQDPATRRTLASSTGPSPARTPHAGMLDWHRDADRAAAQRARPAGRRPAPRARRAPRRTAWWSDEGPSACS